MTILPQQYRKYGYEMTQVFRDGDVAIYQQADEETGKIYAYEVFIVQKQEAGELFGRAIEAKELPPGTEQWGRQAYTCRNIEEARVFAEKLQTRITARSKNEL